MTDFIETLEAGGALRRLIERQVETWPEHRKYLAKSFEARDPEVLENARLIADCVEKIAGPRLDEFVNDYRWMCEKVTDEEINFRRTGAYRYSSLEDVIENIYDNAPYMKSYLHGILMSQLFWSNHASTIHYYATSFLRGNAEGCRHLEIGPGHGLLLSLAVLDRRCSSLRAWDISETALQITRESLKKQGVARPVQLEVRDVLGEISGAGAYDSIVLSEVLEHTLEPARMLSAVRGILAPGGRLFINVPVNSPAPDHIYLLKSPEEAAELIERAGFKIAEKKYFPMTGYSLDQARQHELTISCAFIVTA